MILYQRLCEHARRNGDKTAIEFQGESLSYIQLKTLVDACVDFFDDTGLGEGDRIAVLAQNHPDWFIALFAADRAGVLLVPLNTRLSVEELSFAVNDATPALLLHDEEFAAVATALAQRVTGMALQSIGHPDFPPDHAVRSVESRHTVYKQTRNDTTDKQERLIVYTSGTTGRPKGAVLSNTALLCSATMSQHMLALGAEDRVLNVLPLFHVGGLNIQSLPALLFGATLVLHDRFNPDAALQAIASEKITLVTVVPALLQRLIDCDSWGTAQLGSLRAVSIGSTDVPVSLLDVLEQRNVPVLQVYGATETSPAAIYQSIDQPRLGGSIGRQGLCCRIRLADARGRVVPIGESGEIQVKGDNILERYWNNAIATENDIRDGWFSTGDVAHKDANGNFWFDGRLKQVVISGGENIYPAELERLIRPIRGVDDVVIVGRPDDRWGEVPVAVIIAHVNRSEPVDVIAAERQALATTIARACEALARFKRPKDIVFVDDFPRNALGKVQIAQLRERLGFQAVALRSQDVR